MASNSVLYATNTHIHFTYSRMMNKTHYTVQCALDSHSRIFLYVVVCVFFCVSLLFLSPSHSTILFVWRKQVEADFLYTSV